MPATMPQAFDGATKAKPFPRNRIVSAKVTSADKTLLEMEAIKLGLPLSEHINNILAAHVGLDRAA